MKYFIFNMKFRSVYPTFDMFQKMLKIKLDMEKEIAFMNDKIDTHRLKWTNFINYQIWQIYNNWTKHYY